MLIITNEIKIPHQEFEFTFARSSGPGGQNINKVSSKAVLRWNAHLSASLPEDVRLRFIQRYANRFTNEKEILITSDRFRDQRLNQEDCLEKLRRMLMEVAYPPKLRLKTAPTYASKLRKAQFKRNQQVKKQFRKKLNLDVE